MTTIFLSDLHLPPEPSALRETFLGFLSGPATRAEAVYILGDLFEYWIGDDVGLQVYAKEVAALATLSGRGIPLYFMHGNRDFMVGRKFAKQTGAKLLHDPTTLDLCGVRTLISHGDIFCTDDLGYQRWRRFSRNPIPRWVFERLPVSRRERIAGGLRSSSRNKAESIMDVNETTIRAAFKQHRVQRIIHGHTHRPAEHRYDLSQGFCERIVLADWRPQQREILEVSDAGLRRINLD